MAGWPTGWATTPRAASAGSASTRFATSTRSAPWSCRASCCCSTRRSVRLGQAGAGGVPSPAPSQARHDLGGAGRARDQHRAGHCSPGCCCSSVGQLNAEPGHLWICGESEERDLRQRRSGLLQHAADPAARRGPGADRAAAARARLAVRPDRALWPADHHGRGLHRPAARRSSSATASTRSAAVLWPMIQAVDGASCS